MTSDTLAATPSVADHRLVARRRLTTALIAIFWAWVVVPQTLQTILAPKYKGTVGLEGPATSSIAKFATYSLTAGIAVLCLWVIVDSLGDRLSRPALPLALMLAPWLYYVLRDAYVGTTPDAFTVVYPLLVVAIWMLRPRFEWLVPIGYLTGAAALLSMALAVIDPAKGIFHTAAGSLVSEDKVILPWGILVGFLTHGNTIGQFLALGLPFVAMIPRARDRRLLLAVTVFAIVWSASRSALAAVAVAVLVAAVLRITTPPSRRTVGTVAALAPFALTVALPVMTTDPTAFANRGFIWSASITQWTAHPWLGLGSDWYKRVGGTTDRLAGSAFSGHNQYVQFLVTGGIVLLVLVVPLVVAAAVRAGRIAAAGQPTAVVFLAVLGTSGLLEKTFSFVDFSAVFGAVFIPLAVVMMGEVAHRAEAEAETESATGTDPPSGTRRDEHSRPGSRSLTASGAAR